MTGAEVYIDGQVFSMTTRSPIPTSPAYAGNAAFIEDLYETYLANAESVEPNWRLYFDSLRGSDSPSREMKNEQIRELFRHRSQSAAAGSPGAGHGMTRTDAHKQSAVARLIHAYRLLGHLARGRGSDQPARASQYPGPGSRVSRADRVRHGHGIHDRQSRRQVRNDAPRNRGDAAGNVHRVHRLRVHAYGRRGREAVAPDAAGEHAHEPGLSGGRQSAAPGATHRGGGPRAISSHEVRGPEAILPRGRRVADHCHRRNHPARRHAADAGSRDRHGAPRAAQRAGERHGEIARASCFRNSRASTTGKRTSRAT